MIELRAVRKSYSSETTIGPVELTIPAGGMTALVGPNGAGKSTLLTMIGRLLGIDAGAIEIAGYDVSTTLEGSRQDRVDPASGEQLRDAPTVRQLVGFGRFPSRRVG